MKKSAQARLEKAAEIMAADGVEPHELPMLPSERPNGNGWVTPWPVDHPRHINLEYQERWINDGSRFKAAVFSRQTGKDHSSNCEIVHDCHSRATDWMIAAPSERQSLTSLKKAKAWAEAYELAIEDVRETKADNHPEARIMAKEIELIPLAAPRQKSSILAVPGHPDTLRGESRNVLITEADHLEDPRESWRALLPSITNPLRGGEKKVRLIGTPNGDRLLKGIFHPPPDKPGKLKWSTHVVTIEDAVHMGLGSFKDGVWCPVDIEELLEAMDDPAGARQEFYCEFLDSAEILFPYDLLASAEDVHATETAGPDYWTPEAKRGTRRVMGIDVGRKRDLTVCWTADIVGGLRLTRDVMALRNMPIPEQARLIYEKLKFCDAAAIDETGMGVGLADILEKMPGIGLRDHAAHKYGRLERVTFSNTFKVEAYPRLRARMEQRNFRIPKSRTIREDLHSIYRSITPKGLITYIAPSSADGHADHAAAAVLCDHAAENPGRSFHYSSITPGNKPGGRAARNHLT